MSINDITPEQEREIEAGERAMSGNDYHPDNSLPDCMMPDGGDCCVGYRVVLDDWRTQLSRTKKANEALRLIADIAEGSTTANSLPHIAKIARAALAPEQDK